MFPLIEAQKPLTLHQTAEQNIARYFGKCPTPKNIHSLVKSKLGISYHVFEAIWGMPHGTIRRYVNKKGKAAGFRTTFPPKYWHIIYDFFAIKKMVQSGEVSIPVKNIEHAKVVALSERKVLPANLEILEQLKQQLNG